MLGFFDLLWWLRYPNDFWNYGMDDSYGGGGAGGGSTGAG